MQVWSLSQENPLEKETETHSIILVQEIPWTEGAHEWKGYIPWSCKRVVDNLATKQQYSIVYMYHIFFIHSPVDGNLGCFHVLAIVNSSDMTIRVQESFWIMEYTQ